MYSILIADDEPIVCRLLEHLIDWENLHMESAGFASTGLQALETIQCQRPDIVITDIRMPGMDGLELIRRVREAGISTEFVIISGYREFEFARQALQYQVRDYLLKPIREQELNTLLYRLSRKLQLSQDTEQHLDGSDKELRALQRSIRKDWLARFLRQEVKETTWDEVNRKYHFQWPEGFFMIWEFRLLPSGKNLVDTEVLEVLVESFQVEMKTFFSEAESVVDGEHGFLLVGGEHVTHSMEKAWEQMAKDWRSQKETISGRLLSLSSGPVFHTWNEAAQAERQAHNALCKALWKGSGYYPVRGEAAAVPKPEWDEATGIMLEKALYTMDASVLDQTLAELEEIQKAKTPGNYLAQLELLETSMEYLHGCLKKMLGTELEELESMTALRRTGSCKDIHLQRKEFCQKVVDIGLLSRKMQVALPIRTIENYMKEHYAKKLSLEDMAELVHMNAAYISALFKKKTGKNFSDYLTELRMEQAKLLLWDARWNVSEVAEKVGYTDVRYFSKSFSKTVGISPTEYRRLHS